MLLAKELQKPSVVCSTTADEIYSLGVGWAEFDLFAAIIKALAIFIRYELIDLGNGSPTTELLGSSDVDEERLVGRASKGTEEVVEVIFTSGTAPDDLVGGGELVLQGIELLTTHQRT